MVVTKAKTAFGFWQADKLAGIMRRDDVDGMGKAMKILSAEWQTLSDLDRKPYLDREEEDRARYQRECRDADEAAYLAHQERKKKNQMPAEDENLVSSSRGARAQQDAERAKRDAKAQARREAADARLTEEEREERRAAKAAKRAEVLERQRKKDAEEKAVADRHKKLDKEATKKTADRLKYLLAQSDIFSRLKDGKSRTTEDASRADAGGGYKSKHSPAKKKGRPKKDEEAAPDGEGLDEDDEEEGESHTFLTKQPSCIKFGTLKPYQLEGLNWMIHLAEKGLNGILADEMGLGKTLQSISILAYHYEYLKIQGPHLICVPKSTLSNWMNELNRWCPSLRVIRFHGMKDEREELVEDYFTNEAAAHDGRRPTRQIRNEETGEMEDDNSDNPRAWDVCVTTYEMANMEKRTLGRFAWKYLIIDEAHRLKNEASMFSTTVREFNTANRLLLTGTPLQNNLHELWALLNFLLPDIFSSSQQFDEWFNLEIDDADAKKKMISQLHGVLRPFMIRRLKADVAKGLPPKTETLVMVGMSKMQKQLYKRLLLRDIKAITGKNTNSGKTAVLNIVMQLRKCCNHPYLFEGIEDRTLDPLGEHLVDNCGKLNMVDKLLKKLKERGSRVLIFTQMTRILDIMEDFMHMRGYKYCRLDGQTDYETRERSIREFNAEGSEKFCFILSTRAGGLGINLQTADTCILYDSDWNPQADLQAQDRCHRLGQKKPVSIFRLVTENTVEQKIIERAQQKLKLDAMVVQQGRLKEKDKVTKEEVMAAVRFGADAVFRSEESTISNDDIDVILERGKAKTKELADKITKAEKGDLLDFRLDGGVSSQTFEGIDYSDAQLRNQLRLLAADSMGKRERKPPPVTYTEIIQPKKSMVIKNQKIRLPRPLRLPSMEDHQFYNRARLLEISDKEFQLFATLKETGKVPSYEYMEQKRTILPPNLAKEKWELLAEGFSEINRSQFFHFIKACTKYGRADFDNISEAMGLPTDLIRVYSTAFWEYGPTELKSDEWERVKGQIEKGERRLEKQREQEKMLGKFVATFDNPETDITFANKGNAHFSLEQDRAILCAVAKHGYGNWEKVREEIRNDSNLLFHHTVQGMNIDAISKRCDYRLRQMEKELETREKKINVKPPAVVEAESTLEAIRQMEEYEIEKQDMEMRGQMVPPIQAYVSNGLEVFEDYLRDQQECIDGLREIETQIRGCNVLAEETKECINRGDQYVNYSHIVLRGGGSRGGLNDDGRGWGVSLEERINASVLSIPECGACQFCVDPSTNKICIQRRYVRDVLVQEEMAKVPTTSPVPSSDSKSSKAKSLGPSASSKVRKKPGPKPGSKKSGPKPKKARTTSPKPDAQRSESQLAGDPMEVEHLDPASQPPQKEKKKPGPKPKKAEPKSESEKRKSGGFKMSVPENLLPEFAKLIGVDGTNLRNDIINDFTATHPNTSARQVTIKFSEMATKNRPETAKEAPKQGGRGRAVWYYLRPMFYHLLEESERPSGWEEAAKVDNALYEKEIAEKERATAEKKLKASMKAKDANDGMTTMTSSAANTDDEVGSTVSSKF